MRVKWQDRRFLLYQSLFWLCLRFREVSWVDTAFVQKVKDSFQAPGRLIKWHGFCPPIHFWVSLCWVQKALWQERVVPLFTQNTVFLFFIHERLRRSLLRLPCGTQQNVFCVCVWPLDSHSCHFKSSFFVLQWCPPSFLHRGGRPWCLKLSVIKCFPGLKL